RAESAPISIIDLQSRSGACDGPSHHGAAMFRRDTYVAAGGYRAEFHYSQDWDLWFRIGERGTFRTVPEVLYVARVTPASISTTARAEQELLARIARDALLARASGESDATHVTRAAAIVPQRRARSGRAEADGLYFIGEALRRRGDVRARRYLRRAIAARPIHLRAWIRWGQSLAWRRRP
ncbi:MAG TPA: hypothetical protein VND45_00955, partial [Thermoanaerobaculia bacterium]|nr:hypothetical protein [Thermoanaerobaculia bacterium]